MTGAMEGGGEAPDPWAEAEAAVRGEAKPAAGTQKPAPAPKPASKPAAAAPVDPWAEAEAAILGVGAPKVESPSEAEELPVETAEAEPQAPAAELEPEVPEAELANADPAGADPVSADDASADLASADPEEASLDPDAASPDAASDTSATEDDGLDDGTLLRALSALVLASPEPLSTARLCALVGESSQARVRTALEALGERLVDGGLGIVLVEIAGGWRYATEASLGELVGQLFASRRTERISPAGLETLAIVAYRQPVTKGEIEAIRGVQAGPILRTLVDRGLVRVAGRADQPGAPLLYATTREFLDRFGLARLEDLPRDGELARD